jgi:hypothetical protein
MAENNRKEFINGRFADGKHVILLVIHEQQAGWLPRPPTRAFRTSSSFQITSYVGCLLRMTEVSSCIWVSTAD